MCHVSKGHIGCQSIAGANDAPPKSIRILWKRIHPSTSRLFYFLFIIRLENRRWNWWPIKSITYLFQKTLWPRFAQTRLYTLSSIVLMTARVCNLSLPVCIGSVVLSRMNDQVTICTRYKRSRRDFNWIHHHLSLSSINSHLVACNRCVDYYKMWRCVWRINGQRANERALVPS